MRAHSHLYDITATIATTFVQINAGVMNTADIL